MGGGAVLAIGTKADDIVGLEVVAQVVDARVHGRELVAVGGTRRSDGRSEALRTGKAYVETLLEAEMVSHQSPSWTV